MEQSELFHGESYFLNEWFLGEFVPRGNSEHKLQKSKNTVGVHVELITFTRVRLLSLVHHVSKKSESEYKINFILGVSNFFPRAYSRSNKI